MESYPGELLVGVFPLIFCVDATLEKKEEGNRSQFDKFLDTISITSSMVDDGGNDDIHEGGPMMQKVEEEQSEKEDDLLLNSGAELAYPKRRGGAEPLSPKKSKKSLKKLLSKKKPNDPVAPSILVSPDFATALQQGQSFFQRARIVSSSVRHGFPPSKDPTGMSNRVIAITGLKHGQQPPHKQPTPLQNKQQLKQAINRLNSATQARPIDGILPSGWLEKHAAALPSVIVVVTQIHPATQQAQQDKMLLEALENLQHSLAPKRKVAIKVVAVIQEGVSPIMADQWSQGMLQRLPSFLQGSESVMTLVEARELRSMDESEILPPSINNPKTSPLPSLHQSIRTSSLRYYKDRSQEIKGKLIRLRGPQGVTNRSPLLMPLLIRYYFKAAIFYEFQWKQDKSLKYMVEAYRLVENYYNYLLFWKEQKEIGEFRDDEEPQTGGINVSEKEDPQSSVLESPKELGVGEGVETSLSGTASTVASSVVDEYLGTEKPPIVAEDMIYQCRKIADWLNFKILQLCMVCHNKSGTIAASVQWQKHAKTFCCPLRSFLNTPWLDWAYVSQQRIVMSQMLERHPPKGLGELWGASGADTNDEDLIRCSSWRTYEAAAEALLKAGHCVRAVIEKGGISSLPLPSKSTLEGTNRIRYVGCIDHEGFHPWFEEESQKPHTEKALNCALRGISLFEKELEKLETDKKLIPWSRSGARLYYLAGGALIALKKYSDAIPHLEKAAKLCQGWTYLQSLVQRMLIDCYEKQDGSALVGTENEDDDVRMARTSFLLQSYFNAGLSSDELAKALEKLVTISGLDVGGGNGGGGDGRFLRWHCDFLDDDMSQHPTPPFSFALAFPASTHGTPGDKVKVNVWIQSNLRNSVCINRMSAMTFLGPLSIPLKGDGIKILPNEVVQFETEISLPVELSQDTVDGDNSGSATIPKPITSKRKSSGFTAAGGSRYAEGNEDEDDEVTPLPWTIRCLGGKPLRCEGMIFTFSVVSSATNNTFVKLAIGIEQPEAPPNTKRTVFDENNYLSSTWKRPKSLPLSKGPRSLRLLSPVANMSITNVTEEVTGGKALEGTVNRVVLKLKAGDDENCEDIVIMAKSTSSLTSSDGEEKAISLQDTENDSEDSVDMMNPLVRAPALVKLDPSSKNLTTDFGYTLPSGWALAYDGRSEEGAYSITVPSVLAGEEIYVCFDVYRPTSRPLKAPTEANGSIVEEMTTLNDCECETEINLSINYSQEISGDDTRTRSLDVKPKNSVSLEHDMTVVWSSPMSIGFSSVTKDAYPSGNQNPSNIVQNDSTPEDADSGIMLIDGRKVFTKGVLESRASTYGLDIEIDKVQFVDTESENTHCDFQLLSGLDGEGTIFRTQSLKPCRSLKSVSKISFGWMAQVNMDMYYREQTLTASIGAVSVHWQPSPILLSEDLTYSQGDSFAGLHGPLQLEQPAVCSFSGPLCRIQSAPFEVVPENLPDSIKFAAPFEVKYRIRNKTPIDQEFEVAVQDAPISGDESTMKSFVIGGDVNKSTSLGPFESHLFSYTTVPMIIGKVHLPAVSISSKRYKTWTIRESLERRPIFVQP